GMEKSSPNGDSNIGMWFLKDGTVGCDSTAGTKDFAGNHQDGDLLVVSSFTNGGDVATVQAFRWQGGANGSLNTTPATTGGKCPAPSTPDPIDPATGLPAAACATVNNSPVTPTWAHPDKDGGALNALEFFEGGVDLTALHDEQCFARFLGNTRSSQSPTATIFDFATGSLPVCGTLHVNKYIDANVNGVRDAAEATTNADRAGYHFTVTGPNGDSTVVCSGTTDTAGNLTCSTGSLVDIPVGDYVITETQKT